MGDTPTVVMGHENPKKIREGDSFITQKYPINKIT
jgi:hypothetical protein